MFECSGPVERRFATGRRQDEQEPLGWRVPVVPITGRTLTFGGHQIEEITAATQHNAGRSNLIGGSVPITTE